MDDSKYSWNKKEIFEIYKKCLHDFITTKNKKEKEELKLDISCLTNLIVYEILNVPTINFNNPLVFKKYLDYDREFLLDYTTDFQQNQTKSFIKKALELDFKFATFEVNHNFKKNINTSLSFLKYTNEDLYQTLLNSIKNKRINIKKYKKGRNFAGSTFALHNDNFYQIAVNDADDTFMTIIHEIVHGYIDLKTNRKFDEDKKNALYAELGSILIELYANDYAYKNKIINLKKYVTNFNNVIYSNIYNDIELLDVLYKLAKKDNIKRNYKEVNQFLNEINKDNPKYDINIKDLTEEFLENYLIYFYSGIIAISIYDNHKENKVNGMKVALEFMKNVDEYNEENLFKKYNINPEVSLEHIVDKNNLLIKKIK